MHGEVCMGALIIWLVIMVPVSAILTGLGMGKCDGGVFLDDWIRKAD